MKSISLRAYARHRKATGLTGGTLRSVQVAIRDGRLSRSLTRDRKKIRGAKAADAEWAASTKSDHVPLTGPTAPSAPESPDDSAPTAPSPLTEARTRREAAQAEIREMELAERRGALVSARAVESYLSNLFAQCRTRLLSIPARARQRDPSLSGPQLAVIETMIREALEDLASPPGERNERRAG